MGGFFCLLRQRTATWFVLFLNFPIFDILFDHYKLEGMLNRVPKFFKNFYFVTGAVFLIWIGFLDSMNLVSRFSLTRKLNNLEGEKEYYQERIVEVEHDREELFGNNRALEKFAREKYLMKKGTEHVYVVVEE